MSETKNLLCENAGVGEQYMKRIGYDNGFVCPLFALLKRRVRFLNCVPMERKHSIIGAGGRFS